MVQLKTIELEKHSQLPREGVDLEHTQMFGLALSVGRSLMFKTSVDFKFN